MTTVRYMSPYRSGTSSSRLNPNTGLWEEIHLSRNYENEFILEFDEGIIFEPKGEWDKKENDDSHEL